MHSLTEPEIIEKALQGDTRAFQQLVELHQGFAYALSYRLTGTKGDAEDIVQEVFIAVWKNLRSFNTNMKMRTWLYTIVTNRCLDFLKSREGKQRRNHSDIGSAAFVQNAFSTENQIDRDELMRAVLTIADTLTPKQRAVFVLRDLEELSVPEISEILDMNAGNIKSNLYYARLAVSEKLKTFYQESKRRIS